MRVDSEWKYFELSDANLNAAKGFIPVFYDCFSGKTRTTITFTNLHIYLQYLTLFI